MLIDELLASSTIHKMRPECVRSMQSRFRRAVKFDLSPEFARAASVMSANFGAVGHSVDYCRPPHKYTWIEVVHADRPVHMSAEMMYPEIQERPKRVGFLIEVLDEKFTEFSADIFWSFPPESKFSGGNTSTMTMMIDLKAEPWTAEQLSFDVEVKRTTRIGVHEQWSKTPLDARAKLAAIANGVLADYTYVPPTIKDAALWSEYGRADWAGEAMFVFAVLLLLNTVELTETSPVDQSKLNKARARNGHPPLSDYHIVNVSAKHRQDMRDMVKAVSGEGNSETRLHIVRGHFKRRKTGIHFWRPHWRGSSEAGVVQKDYKL